ncbi:unnamed protein product [Bursaphelenchus okinawaensis]|uniref:Serpentine receptor class gamma n=1 Tax=Bursaphelenchus okinawaensis TaxID=465554 RepID=A0A811K289_9BILA|nr:unnamed protein product [Bursaphelenchus okinawaensis]CAG9089344.1 unnamed protein product [Bursaphelenchus okinawaensis]
MLLLCCIADLNYWVFDNLVHFKSTENDGVFMIQLEGIGGYLNREYQIYIVSMYVFGIILSHTVLPAQAYFRYSVLRNGRALSNIKTMKLFAFAVLAAAPITYLTAMSYFYSPTTRLGLNYGKLWYKVVPIPIVLYGDIVS